MVARTWNLIGNVHFRDRDFRRALFAYKEAVLCGEPGVHLADAYYNLGRAYYELGNAQESIDFLARSVQTIEHFAIALGRDLSTSKDMAAVHMRLGVAWTLLGNGERAKKALALAHGIYELVDCHEGLTETENAMGAVSLKWRDDGPEVFPLRRL